MPLCTQLACNASNLSITGIKQDQNHKLFQASPEGKHLTSNPPRKETVVIPTTMGEKNLR